jgi:hypothetical protein
LYARSGRHIHIDECFSFVLAPTSWGCRGMGKKIGAALSDGESGPDFNSIDDVAKMKARLKKVIHSPLVGP